MNILHYVPSLRSESSGLTAAVEGLCGELMIRNSEVSIYCLEGPLSQKILNIRTFPKLRIFPTFGLSFELALEIRRSLSTANIIHHHSLWTFPNIFLGWTVPSSNPKLVTSPHGTLFPWALNHRKILKRILWPLQRRALTRADLVHVTSESELRQVRKLGIKVPAALIPLGVDLPVLSTEKCEDERRKLLYLSRIHPVKGIEILLDAWKVLQKSHPKWDLVIAGTGESKYFSSIRSKAKYLDLARVYFLGELIGPSKNSAYQSADLFVLPSHSENFGFVVAEALANGCPTIVSRHAPWSMLERNGCGWWVENDVPTLTAALGSAMALPRQELRRMGLLGREWIARDFSWRSTAEKMTMAYEWLAHGGQRPDWISVED